MGGVNEQTAGMHAKLLAENGLTTVTFDSKYQIESKGEPQGLENSFQRAEGVRIVVPCALLRPRDSPFPSSQFFLEPPKNFQTLFPHSSENEVVIIAIAEPSNADQ